MGKYWTAFSLVLQDSLQYRLDFFLKLLAGSWTLVVPLTLWGAVTRETGSALGYSFREMILYLLAVHGLYRLLLANDLPFLVAQEIREGKLNQFLSRPISYPLFSLVTHLGRQAAQLPVLVLPLAALAYAGGAWSAASLLGFLLASVLGLCLSFTLYFLLALTAFWLLESQALFITLGTVLYFLAGGLFPLDVVPGGWLLTILPFSWQLMFPVQILLGLKQGTAIWLGLVVQFGWLAAAAAAAFGLWRRGLKQYQGVGG